MSTSTLKSVEEIAKKRGNSVWLSGFAVFGSLLVLPGLLPLTGNLDIDEDPRQTGFRFFAFNAGFLLAYGLSSPLLKKFGIRPLAVSGLTLAIASLIALTLQPAWLSIWWESLPTAGLGMGAGSIAFACLFALKPWSSRLGARALPRVAELSILGCIFCCLVGGAAYAVGMQRLTPIPLAAGALVCLTLCIAGRKPLAVVEKRSASPDARTRQIRSIAAFLLLCLFFVQLGSEWSVAGWLPLFLIHRLGSGPSAAIFVLALYFLLLLFGRFLLQALAPKLGSRLVTIGGAVLVIAGCLMLTFSGSLVWIQLGLAALAIGFAPPYSIMKSVLDDTLQFPPAFYYAIIAAAVTGAMCAAWLLGYVHRFLGIGALSLFPAAGSVVVFVLELLLMFESHLMSERVPARPDLPTVDRRTS